MVCGGRQQVEAGSVIAPGHRQFEAASGKDTAMGGNTQSEWMQTGARGTHRQATCRQTELPARTSSKKLRKPPVTKRRTSSPLCTYSSRNLRASERAKCHLSLTRQNRQTPQANASSAQCAIDHGNKSKQNAQGNTDCVRDQIGDGLDALCSRKQVAESGVVPNQQHQQTRHGRSAHENGKQSVSPG
jgi:hypothetical protein